MAKILVLDGDGIGPEVNAAALAVLEQIASHFNLNVDLESKLVGGCAIDAHGLPLPDSTKQAALTADAVLLGAVGGPQWDGVKRHLRPESGLLQLRSTMGLYANLRPALGKGVPLGVSPLAPHLLAGVDLLVVRELMGGIYFGQPRGIENDSGESRAFNTMVYTESEIRRIAKSAFNQASLRRKKLTSIDKANVLEVSELWREVVNDEAKNFPGIEVNHMYVDNAAMQMVLNPAQFDVILAGNLFGDILSDQSGGIVGSLGLLPSASYGEIEVQGRLRASALYEPCHGSAPDIAGTSRANPIAAILSVAMMIYDILKCPQGSVVIREAVINTLNDGVLTDDLTAANGVSTTRMQAAIMENITKLLKD